MARRRTRNRKPPLAELQARQHRLNVKSTVQYLTALVVLIVVGLQGCQTHRALCALHGDLAQRVASTQDYLAEHPDPVLFGVPRATIVTNLHNQERTLRTLNGLYC